MTMAETQEEKSWETFGGVLGSTHERELGFDPIRWLLSFLLLILRLLLSVE